jgi:hypothetical protein
MAVTITALLITLGTISPNGAKLSTYLVVFSLFYILFTLLCLLFIELAYAHISRYQQVFSAIVIGFSPTILLALASLTSLSIIDVVLALGIPFVIVWYSLRRGIIK